MDIFGGNKSGEFELLHDSDPELAMSSKHQPDYPARPWTPEDDQMIFDWVQRHGKTNVTALSLIMRRKNSQIWERYHQCLDPSNSKLPYTTEEELKLLEAYSVNQRKFSKTATLFPNRSRYSIKYQFYRIIRRELPEIKFHPEYSKLLLPEAEALDSGSIKKLKKWPQYVIQNISEVIVKKMRDPEYKSPKMDLLKDDTVSIKTESKSNSSVKTELASAPTEPGVTLEGEIIKILSNPKVKIKQAYLTSPNDLLLKVHLGIPYLQKYLP